MKSSAIALLVATLLGGSATVQAATLSIDMFPGGAIDVSRLQSPGDTFTVNVLVDDVLDLAAFQFEVWFDGSIVSASSISSGDLFGIDTFLVDSTINPSSLSFAETTLAAGGVDVLSPVVLAAIQFTVLAEGISVLDLTNSLLGDSSALSIAVASQSDGELIAEQSAVVPEPTTVSLVVVGGLVLAAVRRRSQRPGAMS